MKSRISNLTIRAKTPDDDVWVVDLRNRLNDHLPPSTLESFRHWERIDRLSEHSYEERLIGECDGQRVAYFGLERLWWSKRPGSYFIYINVEPERWSQGIGSQAFDHLLARLSDLKAERAYSGVRNDRTVAQGFAERRGFSKTGHADRWSRLDVRTANLEGYVGVEERLAAEGIRLTTIAETGEDEALLRRLHAVTEEAIADVPSSEEFSGFPYEMFLEELHEPQMAPERAWMAMHGDEPVGTAVLPLRGEHAAFNGFTGVARAYRGKGVARALKLKTIEWCREHGIEAIYTANDVTNQRMLSINHSLGYQELPIAEEVMRQL